MIKLYALNNSGMFSYGMMPTIILDGLGIVLIRGHNGSGKSSFLNSIKEILFGENDTGKSGNNVINNHNEWRNGFFGAIWLQDHNGIWWRIFSIRKWKGEPPLNINDGIPYPFVSEILQNGNTYINTDIYLEKWDGKIWVDERPTSTNNKSFKDTQKKICDDILKMTYNQFSTYVSLGQKAESALVGGTSGSREKIIQAVADVSIWDKAALIINRSINIKENESNLLSNKISGLNGAIQSFSIPTDDDVLKIQRGIDDLNSQIINDLANIDKYKNDLADKNIELTNIKQKSCDIKQEIDLLIAEERHALDRYKSHVDIPLSNEILILQDKISNLSNNLRTIDNHITKYKKLGIGNCPTCGQEVTNQYLDEIMNNYVGTQAKLNDEINILTFELDDMTADHQSKVVADRKQAKDKYEQSSSAIRKRIEELKSKCVDPNILMSTMSMITKMINDADSNIGWKRNQIQILNTSLESVHNTKLEYQKSIDLLNAESAKFDSLNNEIIHYKWVERNLKKLRLHEYETAIDRLNELINETMQHLWGNNIKAHFVLARETAKGNISQEIKLLVETPNRPSVPIEMYSGGETKSIIVSAFRAMRQVSNEHGISVNIAAIDELDKDLDEAKTDALAEALSSMNEECSSCFIISHKSRLINIMNPDRKWVFKTNNEFTIIEEDL